ncbi:CBM35 domain-containing protein [Salibacterium aidingense]|uniref:CBM35 domain-containing protein n=1 Tax=Salibacterium aidingense TaxID=384933 RepID=UPI00041B4F36|nr:CBM35 domain-containing protein [Salibacterium aidingense]
MKKKLWLAAAALFTASSTAAGIPVHTEEVGALNAENKEEEILQVDLSNKYRPVTQVASGALYGLGEEGYPKEDLVTPTKPKMFTQMAPGGTHFPNGETRVLGDALEVAPIAAEAEAAVTIRMPDIYPDFPYQWEGWNDWEGKVRQIVEDVQESDAENIYGYEIWNEPEWTWDEEESGSFLEGWERTYQQIKEIDSETDIIGPSLTQYDEQWLRGFLIHASETDTLPDIISWHELGNPEGNHEDGPAPWAIESHVEDYRALEKELGIAPLRISINEYAVQTEQAVPGSMVQYIGPFERAGVDTANLAFWYRPGRLSNLLTDSMEPNGAWWTYKWYGDMSGEMVMTEPSTEYSAGLDGAVSIDNEKEEVKGIFGGNDGDNVLSIEGLEEVAFMEDTAHVKIEEAPWYGVDTPLSEPSTVLEGEFITTDEKLNIPITDMEETSGYNVTITSSGDAISRYEAEHAAAEPEEVVETDTHASNNRYVQMEDDKLDFQVDVPKDGEYEIQFRYANVSNNNVSQQLAVHGETREAVFTETGASSYETYRTTAHLDAGSNTIRLLANGAIDVDFLQVDTEPKGSFDLRAEAENANIQNANRYNSSYASSGEYVGDIDYDNSSVEFHVEVPADGEYMMETGYANGTETDSTHSLLVNEKEAAEIVYETTDGWMNDVPNFGTRQQKTTDVPLKEGDNTITFENGSSYAELDYIRLTRNINSSTLREDVNHFTNEGLIKNKGISNSLKTKLKKNNMKSFMHQVEAQRGKHISREAADLLLRDAENAVGQ